MSEFIDFIKKDIGAGNVCVLKFEADWCGPCKSIEPKFHEMAEKYPNVNFHVIDVDRQEAFSDEHDIRSLPTFLVFSGQKKVYRSSGTNLKGVEDCLKMELSKKVVVTQP